MTRPQLYPQLYSPLYGKISFDEPLSLHTSIKAGGPAFVWIEPDELKQLCALVKDTKKLGISIFIIGEGCNIIAGGKGIGEICIRLNAPVFKRVEFNGRFVKTGAGVSLNRLLALVSERSLGGYEFLAGLPGSVGGAIFGNAGAQKESISSLVTEIELVTPDGEIKRKKRKNIKFGYRRSGLDGNIIISVIFRFKRKDKRSVKSLLKVNLAKKKQTQDYTTPNVGCIFKNPGGIKLSAGELIEGCGLKGKTCGGAQISMRHANFIINKNNAKPQDILSLIRLIKKRVKDTYGIKLEEEVKIIKWQ